MWLGRWIGSAKNRIASRDIYKKEVLVMLIGFSELEGVLNVKKRHEYQYNPLPAYSGRHNLISDEEFTVNIGEVKFDDCFSTFVEVIFGGPTAWLEFLLGPLVLVDPNLFHGRRTGRLFRMRHHVNAMTEAQENLILGNFTSENKTRYRSIGLYFKDTFGLSAIITPMEPKEEEKKEDYERHYNSPYHGMKFDSKEHPPLFVEKRYLDFFAKIAEDSCRGPLKIWVKNFSPAESTAKNTQAFFEGPDGSPLGLCPVGKFDMEELKKIIQKYILF